MNKDSTALAFLGDALYELSIRRRLVEGSGIHGADRLHRAAVRYVKAAAQAKAMRGLLEQAVLSEAELEVALRARNRKPKSIPKNADPVDYKLATAFEALLGWHALEARISRAEALIDLSIKIIDSSTKGIKDTK